MDPTDADLQSMAAALCGAERGETFRQAEDYLARYESQRGRYMRMARTAFDHLEYCPSRRWSGAD